MTGCNNLVAFTVQIYRFFCKFANIFRFTQRFYSVMNVRIDNSWLQALRPEFESDWFGQLAERVRHAYASTTVYPPAGKIFAAFDACPLDRVKVVILGQDPYHGPGQAEGMSFSVPEGVPAPPSLVNIMKEVHSDTGATPATNGHLMRWAEQGVLMLNSVLTVQAGMAGSHRSFGWERFTDAVIKAISDRCPGVVFMLWGSYAISKRSLIDQTRHLILTAPHPSPLSAYRGFFGCGHFSQANAWLNQHGREAICW